MQKMNSVFARAESLSQKSKESPKENPEIIRAENDLRKVNRKIYGHYALQGFALLILLIASAPIMAIAMDLSGSPLPASMKRAAAIGGLVSIGVIALFFWSQKKLSKHGKKADELKKLISLLKSLYSNNQTARSGRLNGN